MKVLVLLFILLTTLANAEVYQFEGKIKHIQDKKPYPIKGFRCKISIERHYGPRYLAYPLELDPDSKWMCKLKNNTEVFVSAERKMGKDGKWQDKGKVISMEVK